MKPAVAFIVETFKIFIIALIIVVPIRYFLFQPFFVKGDSMLPNFKDGQYLIVDEISYRFRAPERGEVIVLKYPNDPSQKFIKRLIGLPGETIEVKNEEVFINGKVLNESVYLHVDTPGFDKVTLGPNEYFVLGDNRSASSDSRIWGLLPQNDIVGRVVFRAWPFGTFKAPVYTN